MKYKSKIIGKQLLSGGIVSLIGTLPLGFLNLLALQIAMDQGLGKTIFFILGVVCCEAIIIRLTMTFAVRLLSMKKLVFWMEVFTALFLLTLAASNYFGAKESAELSPTYNTAHLPFFLLGVIMNCLNPLQFPFWAGWNLYLINNGHLRPEKPFYYYFLLGSASGTFSGVLVFVYMAQYLLKVGYSNGSFPIQHLFSLFFFILALIQGFKIWRKSYNPKWG